MNLSPERVGVLEENNVRAVHWSEAGSPDASDSEIFSYARAESFIVFTHDLDFGDILAATSASISSVIQLRAEDTSPDASKSTFIRAIRKFKSYLEEGALITIHPEKLRARVLPFEK